MLDALQIAGIAAPDKFGFTRCGVGTLTLAPRSLRAIIIVLKLRATMIKW